MKKNILLLLLSIFNYCSQAQVKDYNVAFDISSGDSISQQNVVRQVEIIKNANPDAKVEVVIYAQALSMALKDKSAHAATLQKLLAMKDVSFKVCAITMKRNNVDASQLLPGITLVPDGIYELITKQREGWGYIKVAH